MRVVAQSLPIMSGTCLGGHLRSVQQASQHALSSALSGPQLFGPKAGALRLRCGSFSRPISIHYCPGKICRLQPKLMISKALPRVEAGNDLNSNSPILSEIWGREVLGMFATMPHESWRNRLFAIAPASTSQTISKVRSSLFLRLLREEPLLLGSVPCHGVRTTDLPREPA